MSSYHAQLLFYPIRTIPVTGKHSEHCSVPSEGDHPLWVRMYIYSVTSLGLTRFGICKNEDEGFLQRCDIVQCEPNTEWRALRPQLAMQTVSHKRKKARQGFLPDRQAMLFFRKALRTTYDPMTSLGFLIARCQWNGFGSILGTGLPCRELRSPELTSQELLMVWEHPSTYRNPFMSSVDALQSAPTILRHFSHSQRCNKKTSADLQA